jgi:hypothetical protein
MANMTDFRRAARDVSNWGRWGDDDELGTLNFITAEKVRQARRAPSSFGTIRCTS